MRVAVVGGTGSFGLALAKRLAEAGYDVVIGSRDAERAAAAAATVGVEGATNADACRAATWSSSRRRPRRRSRPPPAAGGDRDDPGPLGRRRADVRTGRRPADDRGDGSIAARIQEVVDGPVVAGLHSLAARTSAETRRPRRTRSSAATTRTRRQLVLELAGRITSGRAIDCGPLATARALEGLTAVIVNVNKRYKAHAGIRVTGVR